jgi:hypothetical protein
MHCKLLSICNACMMLTLLVLVKGRDSHAQLPDCDLKQLCPAP